MRLPRTVVVLGFVSFLSDVGSDMIFPLLPWFLATLHAGPVALGLIDGAAESVSSLLKLSSGWYSDRLSRKKPLVVAGYAIASLARPFIGLAQTPLHILLARLADRSGKGIRTAPRDALLANATPPAIYGRAFGFHRALDNAGAIAGPALATLLMALGVTERSVFLAALVPGLLCVALVALAVKEPARDPAAAAAPARPSSPAPAAPTRLGPAYRRFLLAIFVFTLGNSSDLFLMWHAQRLGFRVHTLPLLWMGLNAVRALGATAGGGWSDRVGRRRAIVLGWTIYAGVYFALAYVRIPSIFVLLLLVYGLYYNLIEGAYGALVADLVPAGARGRAYGLFHGLVGAATLPASFAAGALYAYTGPKAMFLAGAALAVGGALVLMTVREPNRPAAPAK